MADQENPETTPDAAPPAAEEAPSAPEAAAEETTPAEVEAAEAEAEADVASEEVAPEQAAPAEPQAPQPTPQERRVAARAKRGRRRASTPEERLEVRRAKAAARRRRREQERARKTTKGEGTPPAEHGTGTPQVRMGKVVSDKADKTITVRIDIAKRHRRYRKIVRSSSTLHAHDERNDANEGDLVRVVECRPMSRTKRWRLIEILERAK
jgi:small subunit ribosomal protein S17